MKTKRKLRRPSHATVIAYLALFVALGGTAIAASTLGKNTVGPKQLKKNAVTAPKVKNNAVTTEKVKDQAITGAKIKPGSLTGDQINAATLGTVPSAQTAQVAQTANSLPPAENWHQVGTPGEPGFQGTWKNEGGAYLSVAFFKDHEGIVHLRGAAQGGGITVFTLPPGYRPASDSLLQFSVYCSGINNCENPGVGRLTIAGSGTYSAAVQAPANAETVSFDGISFRAEG